MKMKQFPWFLSYLEKNNLKCIVRSHAEIREGCGMSHEGCYTVFSAPNQVVKIFFQQKKWQKVAFKLSKYF